MYRNDRPWMAPVLTANPGGHISAQSCHQQKHQGMKTVSMKIDSV